VNRALLIAPLQGAWRVLRDDPIGGLLPAAGVLGLQLCATLVVIQFWRELTLVSLVGLVAGLFVARALISAPIRMAMVNAAARYHGKKFPFALASLKLAFVSACASFIETAVVVAMLSATLSPAWWLVARGTYFGAILWVSFTSPVILFAGLVVRSLFVYAAPQSAFGEGGIARALFDTVALGLRDIPGAVSLLLVTECITVAGGILCGAGALPGVALAEVTFVERWLSRTGKDS
jgi:hypothetical protein